MRGVGLWVFLINFALNQISHQGSYQFWEAMKSLVLLCGISCYCMNENKANGLYILEPSERELRPVKKCAPVRRFWCGYESWRSV